MRRALSITINGGITTGALLAGAVVLLALPSAVLAFATRYDNAGTDNTAGNGNADGVGLVPGMALRSLARGPLYPFTPAGMPNRPTRSVTVAVRVDAETAR